jgi:hypothetical protein
MGLAPSGNGENPGKSAVAKVPVPIFSQPQGAGTSLVVCASSLKSGNSTGFQLDRLTTALQGTDARKRAFSCRSEPSFLSLGQTTILPESPSRIREHSDLSRVAEFVRIRSHSIRRCIASDPQLSDHKH